MVGADKKLTVSFVSKMESVNTIFVATDGSDETGTGSKDAPYASVERARDVIRRFKELPEGGVTVYVRGGTYRLTSGIQFTAEDSGTEQSPITYRAYNDEKVEFIGTEPIDTAGIQKVTDETLLNRLLESYARDHLYMLDLKAQGVTLPELSASGNEGGSLSYLWYPQSVKIAKLDTKYKRVTTAEPTRYGQNTYTSINDRQLFFENIFEEIDQPGESYLDRETGILYFYPVGTLKNPTMSIARLNETLITVEGASYLNFDGINVSGGRVNGYQVDGNHITVSDAIIHGIGFNGISGAGTYLTIRDCDIYDCCTNGINLGGGDRVNLVSSGNDGGKRPKRSAAPGQHR